MSLFVIADLHLSFGCNKPMDVFPGWKDYTQRLEQNWRSLVKRIGYSCHCGRHFLGNEAGGDGTGFFIYPPSARTKNFNEGQP